MGRQEVLNILKKNRKWMTNRDIQKFLSQSTNSINRITCKLAYDFPSYIKKKIVKRNNNHIIYFKYIGK